MLLDAGGLDEKHEWTRAAVHDRHFRRAQVNVTVVDAQPGQSRKQMFDGGDADVPVHQGGGQARVADVVGPGGNLDRLFQVDPSEHDTGIRQGRPQCHVNLLPRMDAHARGADDVLQGALSYHFSRAVRGRKLKAARMLAQRLSR